MADDSALKTLWVGDLPYWMDESYIYNMLQASPELVSVKVIRNKVTGVSEGYGFIEFRSHEGAESALRSYGGQLIPGTDIALRVNWAVGGGRRFEEADYSLFVGDIAPDVTDMQLMDEFKRYFPSVKGAKIVTDPATARSKGYGFVRFTVEGERDRALGEMNGYPLNGRNLRCSIATSKSSRPGATTTPADGDSSNTTLFIGGLSAGVTEDQLRSIFGRFGEVSYCKVPPGKGCGFVHYVDRRCAERAMADMNGQIIGSGAVRISWGRSQAKSASLARSSVPGYGYDAYGYHSYDPTAAAYAGYGAAAGAAADPYAAYGAAYGASAYGGYHGAGYDAAGHLDPAAAAAADAMSVYDPLLPPDVEQINESFMYRMAPVLTGCYLHALEC